MVTRFGTATTIAQLNADIATVNGQTAGTGGAVTYEIDVSGTIAESQAITAIALHSGVNLDIEGISVGGTGAAVNGASGSYGGFFVESGNVTIANLLVENTTALGGSGGGGESSNQGGGGDGLGAGGGLFVASGAAVTLDNVSFGSTRAIGGSLASTGFGSATGGALDGRAGSVIGSFGSGGLGGTGTGTGGNGGFGAGGGGGATSDNAPGAAGGLGGFGGKSGLQFGYGTGAPGGGGAGMGGAVFVQSGGTLVVAGSGSESGASATGGSGYQSQAEGFGQGYYLQGSGTSLTFAPGAGQTIAIANEIADDAGSAAAASYTGPAGYTPGSGSLILAAAPAEGSIGAGTLVLSSLNHYVGGTTIESGSLDLAAAGAAGGGAITFDGSSFAPATLMLERTVQPSGTASPFTNTLSAFGANDSLDLVGLHYTTGGAATPLTVTGNTLSVTEGGTTETFTLADVPTGTSYYAHQDSAGTGTVVDTVCFAAGTAIRTARGDVAVEDLRVGELVVTASGEHRPIRWLGHRTIDCRAHPRPREVMPVRIAAHAFAPNRPARDLLVSPGHAICLDFLGEMLIPVGTLVNGATVTRLPVESVTYWHVELDSHDILIAENLPAESFLDCGNRAGLIEQEGEYDRTKGPHTPADFCRPFYDRGDVVVAVRERLVDRAGAQGWRTTDDMDLHLLVDGERVEADVVDGVARFVFPAAAGEVVLASESVVPSDLEDDCLDHRRIGLSVSRLEIDDGLAVRRTWEAGDALLSGLFHPEEASVGARHRFTDGRAVLPPALWADCRTHVMLRIVFDPTSGRRWLAPDAPERHGNVVNFRDTRTTA